ncbi:ethylene-responsive transcription factor ERF020-like [Dendrobium catenatum]|uniref:Ethylene-responsive transcription factor ERF019 n=1 Tax=Dendrobium catenatum TaxID=906689 RepID=A0A2I0XDK4_9ASPA|nr:ethylene-responsive transcription factor ERF020-like [Dendrobium catenatum]PKU85980.1 Ethylene-responsive transcription factor ERF019 [Dendrobium catenatum]
MSSSNGNILGDDRNYKGVRCRKQGKWVSEIRVPGSRDRLWLGTYRSPEAAAVAHDTAFFLLRGPSSKGLNFPDRAANMQWVSLSPRSVQRVASESGMDFDAKLIGQSSQIFEREESSNGDGFGPSGDGSLNYDGYEDISVDDMEILM